MWFFSEEIDEVLPAAQRDLVFGATLPTGFSLVRNAAALGRDNTGRWVSFAANSPRTWYDPVTRTEALMLVEPERTQYVYRSRQPTPTAVLATIAYDSAVQTPFGLGALTVVPNTTSAAHGYNLFFGNAAHGSPLPDNATVALRAVMKPKGYTNVTFFILNKTNVYSSVRVSMEGNGTIASTSGVVSASISLDTDGFYSIEIVNSYGTGTTTPSFNINLHDLAGNRTFAGDGTSGIWVAYLGAEIGTEATSPIINAGITTVTRPADVLTSAPGWVIWGAKSLGIDYVPLSQVSGAVLDLSGTDVLRLSNGLNTVQFDAMVGGSAVASIAGSAPAIGVRRTAIITAGNNNFVLVQTGTIIGNDTLGQVPDTFSTLRVGAQADGTASMPLLLKRLKYWDNSLSGPVARSYSQDLSQAGTTVVRPVVSVQETMAIPPNANIVELVVTMTGDPDGATVAYRTVDGTARAGVDYVGNSGILVIGIGENSGTITIGLSARGTVSDKEFNVEITSASGATVGNTTCQILLQRVIPINAPASTAINFGATLPTGVSLSRSSAAWTRNSTGVWTQVAANGYRNHYTAPGLSGLLIEPLSAEQRLFNSLDPGFTATGGTKASNASTTSPTGTTTTTFRETATTGVHSLAVTLTGSNSAVPTGEVTVSVMIRPVNRRYIRLSFKGIDNITRAANIDLAGTGAVTTTDSGVLVFIEQDPFAAAWYRVGLDTGQAISAGVSAEITLTVQDENNSTSIVGNTANGFDICHVQLEPGYGMSSPIIVSGASAATVRAGDVLLASGTWYQQSSYSLGVRFIRQRSLPAIKRIWIARDVSNGTSGVYAENGVLKFEQPAVSVPVSMDLTGDGVRRAWTLEGVPEGEPLALVVGLDGVLQG